MSVEDISPARLTWWMWLAIGNEDVAKAREWIDRGANIWQPWTGSLFNGTPLQFIVNSGNVAMAKMLLETGQVARGDERVSATLRTALCSGNEAMTRLLLDFGAVIPEGMIEDLSQNFASVPSSLLVLLLDRGANLRDNVRDHDLVVRRCVNEFNPAFLRALIERGLEFELRAHVDTMGARQDVIPKTALQPFVDYFAALDARSLAQLVLDDARTQAPNPGA